MYSRYIEPNLLTVTKHTASRDNAKKSVRVAFFTDTHFGNFYSQEKLPSLVNSINKQEADIVIFGGDFFDNYARDLNEGLIDLKLITKNLSKINAKYGKYAVYGNHDNGGGASRIYDELMSDSGFTVLKNDTASLDKLKINIIGFDDYLLGDIQNPLPDIDNNYYNILVSHEPDAVDIHDVSNADIILSGHSHGGQVVIPYITEKTLPVGAKTYVKGKYDISDDTTLYVSRGIGTTVIPYRFLSVPEILVVDIK